MDAAAIFAIIEKGLTVVGTLIAVGQSATPALQALSKLVAGAQVDEVTQEDLDKTEALLDSLLADFNQPMD